MDSEASLTRRQVIGFDRVIHLEWLDATAAAVASGMAEAEVRQRLARVLDGVVASGRDRGALPKTVTVLTRIWVRVPEPDLPLLNGALEQISEESAERRIALHWALTMAAYPFFTDVAAAIGRMVKLHGAVSLVQLRRKLAESWGERSTIPPAMRRVVRSMEQWGVLRETSSRYSFCPSPRRLAVSHEVAALLVEGLLIGLGRPGLAADGLADHPALFPFSMEFTVHGLAKHARFQLTRQGSRTDVVALR